MIELSPERLRSSHYTDDDQARSSKNKPQEVLNIVEWLQCFGTYMAVISHTAPGRMADLLGYQNLIIQGHLKYQDGCWASYDRQFCQKASATPVQAWSAIDTTLWNLAFTGQRAPHTPEDGRQYRDPRQCEGMPASYYTTKQSSSFPKKQPICLEWNDSLSPGCPHPSCRYEHSCYRCAHNPTISNKYHKAIFCPHKDKKTPSNTPATGGKNPIH